MSTITTATITKSQGPSTASIAPEDYSLERETFHSRMIAPVKIAVVGAGAMGSVYAGLLASAGHEVWAVDRWQEHVDAIRERGLRV